MKKVYKNKENRKLIPGQVYSFTIMKELKLPDGNEYYILKDSDGDKHLLPSKFYKHYPIQVNSVYNCMVDKINCQGRLFFEPENPFYKVGMDYLFAFDKIVVLVSKRIGVRHFYKMKGKNGDWAYLLQSSNNRPVKGKFEKYLVVKIKKARIFIQKPITLNTDNFIL